MSKSYIHLEARHIVALGSPWTDASGLVLLSGSECREEINGLAITSCSAEMALEPLAKIMQRIHDFHAKIVGIHPALAPVQVHMKAAIESLSKAEKCFQKFRDFRST